MIQRTVKYPDLSEAFFPVEEQPICLDGFMGQGNRRIYGYKALVDKSTGKTISVVSQKYRLVLNEEAFKLADYVIREIFDGKTLNDFKCYNIHMPQTKGSCRIDLIIPNKYNQLFGDEKESWVPFVRISNSYNRTIKLKYEIGFCRWICLNGVIFGQTGISFSITHYGQITHADINRLVQIAKKQLGSIASLWAAFEKKMKDLKNIPLPISSALALYCKVFDIKIKEEDEKKIKDVQKERLALRAKQIVNASKEYFKDLGNNAYAMMNVLTDFASFPEWTDNKANYVDGYQRRVGKWVDDILAEHKKGNFNLAKYIGDDYQNTSYILESLLTIE